MTTNWQELDRAQKGNLIRPYIEEQQLSYSQIAAIIGVSRVAVAGAADRNNIKSPYSRGVRAGIGHAGGAANKARASGSVAATRRNAPGKIPTAPRRPHKFVATHIPEAIVDRRPARPDAWDALEGTTPRPLHEHQAGQCLWPVGPEDGPALFCCADVDPKGVYCTAHRALSYKPTPPLRLKGKKS